MIPIKVPPLGESITEATISRWVKKEGEAVAAGDTIVELETDKITVEVPALNAGVLAKHLKAEGDVVHPDEILAELDEAGAAASAVAVAAAPTPAPPTAIRAAPSATRLAAETGTDLHQVSGTGRGGVVSKPDVVDYIEFGKSDPAAAAPAPAPAARKSVV